MSGTAVMQSWVAFGPAGAVGWVQRRDDGFVVQMVDDGRYRGVYPSLGVAKQALYSAMGPGAEWPEFHEH